MKHYDPAIHEAINGLMLALWHAGLKSLDAQLTREIIAQVIDEAGMLVATDRIIAELADATSTLANHLIIAGIEPHEIGRWRRNDQDPQILREHRDGLLHILSRRRVLRRLSPLLARRVSAREPPCHRLHPARIGAPQGC